MQVQAFTVNPFAENTYVCHDAGEAVVIDPGCSTLGERQAVLDYLATRHLTVRHLLLTHAHIDHIIDCAFFARHFNQRFQMHQADVPLLENADTQARMFGVEIEPPPLPGALLAEGDTVAVGEATWRVLHCPGHSPGSICFYDAENGFVIGGDVLFQGSVGRTDLWKGSMEQLMTSIHRKLLPLDDHTLVYAGHGPPTTIGRERAANPFLY